jgi:hypothetical protein
MRATVYTPGLPSRQTTMAKEIQPDQVIPYTRTLYSKARRLPCRRRHACANEMPSTVANACLLYYDYGDVDVRLSALRCAPWQAAWLSQKSQTRVFLGLMHSVSGISLRPACTATLPPSHPRPKPPNSPPFYGSHSANSPLGQAGSWLRATS